MDAQLKTGSTSTKLIGWMKAFLRIGRPVYIFFFHLRFAAFFELTIVVCPFALATEELGLYCYALGTLFDF